jgi:hypothetical protein
VAPTSTSPFPAASEHPSDFSENAAPLPLGGRGWMQRVRGLADTAKLRLDRVLVAGAATAGALRIAGGHASNDRAPQAAGWQAAAT